MMYVLDTNIIRTLLRFFPKKGRRYEEVWEMIEDRIKIGEFISVDECYNELTKQCADSSDDYLWIKHHKEMFQNPGDADSLVMRGLFDNPKMRESVHQKNILDNRPSADAYIAAKAKTLGATVVTAEKLKPNSAQLPNLCKELDVRYISYDDFMELLDELIEKKG